MGRREGTAGERLGAAASPAPPVFSVSPSHGVLPGCGNGQPTTASLKVTCTPAACTGYVKVLRFAVDKGRGCEILLRGTGTNNETIEALIM